MNRFHRLGTTAMVSLLAGWISLPGFAQDTYPKPVSEYAEETGLGSMAFLSYPKYHRDAQGKLVPVQTALVPSSDPAVDYEVTEGIWQLKVRKDGTFQAEHEGDVFTYRFNSLGTGRGSGFKPFELGEADFSRFIVTGDTIRWSDVYKDIDLSVRYIHDILKVDVIVKNAFMVDLKAEARAGSLNKNDYLTARFDIPQVLLTSKAKQNGVDKDLYAEALDVDQLLYFEKNGKEVHILRPVETFLLDSKGEPVYSSGKSIRSAQTWRLNPNQSGFAEMSANIGDLVDLPDGDVAIDPSMTFNTQSLIVDSLLDLANPNTEYTSDTRVFLDRRDRFVVGFDVSALSQYVNITKANLNICTRQNDLTQARNYRAYKITETWVELFVNWNSRRFTSSWTNEGGTFESTKFVSPSTSIPTTLEDDYFSLDVTQICKSHVVSATSDMKNFGFLIKREDDSTGTDSDRLEFATRDSGSGSLRPYLIINYEYVKFGNHHPESLSLMADDQYSIERYYTSHYQINDIVTDLVNLWNYNNNPQNSDIKLLLNFHCGPINDDANTVKWWQMDGYSSTPWPAPASAVLPEHWGQFINYRMRSIIETALINNNASARLEDVVYGVELGNEEEYKWGADAILGGSAFADYHIEAADMLRTNWPQIDVVGGGCIEDTRSFGDSNHHSVKFLKSFIEQVKNTNFDLLPKTLAVHGYDGQNPPEFLESGAASEWAARLKQLFDICSEKGYIPNFALTEYGYCATYNSNYTNVWAPTNASEITQALSYLRKMLMNATMHTYNGIGWSYDYTYFHEHTLNPPVFNNVVVDFGFFNYTSPYAGRDIRTMPQEMFGLGTTAGIKLGRSENKVWVPLKTGLFSGESYAWCGWESESLWGAIWRYKAQLSFYFADETDGLGNPIERSFIVSQDVSGRTAQLYKFDLTQNPPVLTNTRSLYINPNWFSGGVTTIPVPYVDENPTFVKF